MPCDPPRSEQRWTGYLDRLTLLLAKAKLLLSKTVRLVRLAQPFQMEVLASALSTRVPRPKVAVGTPPRCGERVSQCRRLFPSELSSEHIILSHTSRAPSIGLTSIVFCLRQASVPAVLSPCWPSWDASRPRLADLRTVLSPICRLLRRRPSPPVLDFNIFAALARQRHRRWQRQP